MLRNVNRLLSGESESQVITGMPAATARLIGSMQAVGSSHETAIPSTPCPMRSLSTRACSTASGDRSDGEHLDGDRTMFRQLLSLLQRATLAEIKYRIAQRLLDPGDRQLLARGGGGGRLAGRQHAD